MNNKILKYLTYLYLDIYIYFSKVKKQYNKIIKIRLLEANKGIKNAQKVLNIGRMVEIITGLIRLRKEMCLI